MEQERNFPTSSLFGAELNRMQGPDLAEHFNIILSFEYFA